MSNYNTLKTAIQNAIKTNGQNEITGAILQASLLSMVNTLGAGYQYMGVATPVTNPGTADYKMFYMAAEPGRYLHFDNYTLVSGLCIFYYDTTWHHAVLSLPYLPLSGGTITGNLSVGGYIGGNIVTDDIDTAGNLSIGADGTLSISSGVDEIHLNGHVEVDGNLSMEGNELRLGSNAVIQGNNDDELDITAGGDITITAEDDHDINLVGNVKANGEAIPVDSDLVHKAGEETIAGQKTFTNPVLISGILPGLFVGTDISNGAILTAIDGLAMLAGNGNDLEIVAENHQVRIQPNYVNLGSLYPEVVQNSLGVEMEKMGDAKIGFKWESDEQLMIPTGNIPVGSTKTLLIWSQEDATYDVDFGFDIYYHCTLALSALHMTKITITRFADDTLMVEENQLV